MLLFPNLNASIVDHNGQGVKLIQRVLGVAFTRSPLDLELLTVTIADVTIAAEVVSRSPLGRH